MLTDNCLFNSVMETEHLKISQNISTSADRIGSDHLSLWRIHKFDRKERAEWMGHNWSISLYVSVLYVIFLYLGQKLMKTRKPLNLKGALVLWNFGLAAFSIIASASVLTNSIERFFKPNGWHNFVCAPWDDLSDDFLFYGWLFTLSKIVELGDTVFLVLRKKPLIFLHWYHHITVLVYCWFTYSSSSSTDPGFITLNYFVHSAMYTYYALRAMKINLPKGISMTITSLQMTQMLIGLSLNVAALTKKLRGGGCEAAPWLNIILCISMLISYFVLFSKFFIKTYGKKAKVGKQTKKVVKTE